MYKLEFMSSINQDELLPSSEIEKSAMLGLESFYLAHDAILDRRSALGMSQQALAELLGVSQPAISSFESRGSVVSVQTLIRYAAALGLVVEIMVKPQPKFDLKNPTKVSA
jgi:plasmid maintenance system antidote protein VapI